jgi:phosphoglycolate phosphatase
MNHEKRIAAVIFDCDGVMFDSRQANINFYNHLLSRYGLPPLSDEQIRYVHMNTAEKSVRYIFEGTPFGKEAQAYRLQMDYTPFIKDMVMEPGLPELLGHLRSRAGLGVATNRSNTIWAVLNRYGLSDFFDIVVSSLDVENPKPHPESIYKILDFFSLDPEQAVYIGDSPIDLETAQAAGVHFIAYGNDGLRAQITAETMADVQRILAEDLV